MTPSGHTRSGLEVAALLLRRKPCPWLSGDMSFLLLSLVNEPFTGTNTCKQICNPCRVEVIQSILTQSLRKTNVTPRLKFIHGLATQMAVICEHTLNWPQLWILHVQHGSCTVPASVSLKVWMDLWITSRMRSTLNIRRSSSSKAMSPRKAARADTQTQPRIHPAAETLF